MFINSRVLACAVTAAASVALFAQAPSKQLPPPYHTRSSTAAAQ